MRRPKTIMLRKYMRRGWRMKDLLAQHIMILLHSNATCSIRDTYPHPAWTSTRSLTQKATSSSDQKNYVKNSFNTII